MSNQPRRRSAKSVEQAGAFVGWRRLRGQRWRAVVRGDTYSQCWQRLLDFVKIEGQGGECMVRAREDGPP